MIILRDAAVQLHFFKFNKQIKKNPIILKHLKDIGFL